MVLTAALLHLEQIDSTESLFLVPNEHDEENICKAFNTYFCMNAYVFIIYRLFRTDYRYNKWYIHSHTLSFSIINVDVA